MDRKELENRLIDYSVTIINISDSIPNSKAGSHLSGQLVRSGTSPALNYGEAQSAESRKDFIHKIQIVLKELCETVVNLKIIDRAGINQSNEMLLEAIKEGKELISIFVKSVETAKNNMH